jgi:indole-3-glycerol phosphate synthase
MNLLQKVGDVLFLNKIIKYKKSIISNEKENLKVQDMHLEKRSNKFINALKEDNLSFICEIKKASPSKGIIKENFDPVEIASEYSSSGASAISVLTEDKFFLGDLEYLKDLSFIDTPKLRKDFIIDEYQIYQSIHYGADAVLLIANILSEKQLKDYISILGKYNVDALVEVHDLNDLDKAIKSNAKIIGVNNRNLVTFEVSLEVSKELINHIPDDVIKISESGIVDSSDISYIKELGFDGVLIGETLMRAPSIKNKLKEFKSYG